MNKPSVSDLPEQAVILCGGRGERLRPLTDCVPKPMVDVNGMPFLEHLMRQLAIAGFERFLVLTGYLGEQIKHHLGDGGGFGWTVQYSDGPADWLTGRRLIEAAAMLDRAFLLAYSDNYAQVDLGAAAEIWHKLNTTVTVHVAQKTPGNLHVDEGGLVTFYDRSRTNPAMTHVEVGYALVHRDRLLDTLTSLPGAPDCDLSDGLEILAQTDEFGAVALHGDYHSVSDPSRLEGTRSYLHRDLVLLLDRDGTINRRMPSGEYVTSWAQFEWIPETVSALIELAERGFRFIVVTNQAGVARGMIDPNELDEIHSLMVSELAGLGVPVDAVIVCTDHWLDGSYRRKPAAGMLIEAASLVDTALEMLVFVGDDPRDLEAASRAGCGFVYVTETLGDVEFPRSTQLRIAVNNMTQAVEPICAFYGLEVVR